MTDGLGEQLRLDIEAIVAIPVVRDEPLVDRFDRFRTANPHVERELVKIARYLKAQGFRRAGIALLFERLRWAWALQTQGDSYKLNNSLRSHYARRIMERYPDLAGFFEIRRLRTE